MERGVIEGNQARRYDEWVTKSENTTVYNNFILNEIKGTNYKICDLCCGSGITIDLLKKKAKQIVGVDASKEMISICMEKFEKNRKIRLLNASATDTKLKAGYFDYAILRMGLHHIKEKRKAIDEIYRILKPNGKLIVIDKHYLNKTVYSLFELLKALYEFDFSRIDHFVESEEENRDVLLSGFIIVKYELLPPSRWRSKQVFMTVLQKKA